MKERKRGGEGCPEKEDEELHDLRDRSCLLLCSLRLKARLQNWHLYFFSGAEVFLAGELLAVPGAEGAICVKIELNRLKRESKKSTVVLSPG